MPTLVSFSLSSPVNWSLILFLLPILLCVRKCSPVIAFFFHTILLRWKLTHRSRSFNELWNNIPPYEDITIYLLILLLPEVVFFFFLVITKKNYYQYCSISLCAYVQEVLWSVTAWGRCVPLQMGLMEPQCTLMCFTAQRDSSNSTFSPMSDATLIFNLWWYFWCKMISHDFCLHFSEQWQIFIL
jgi:hypothetical protein